MADDRLLAVADVAAWLGTRVQHVYVLIGEGTLEAVNIGKPEAKRPTWRIPESTLLAYMKARKAPVRGMPNGWATRSA